MADFVAIRDDYLLGPKWMLGDASVCLKEMLRQCERLEQNPGLFAEECMRIQFFASVRRYCRQIVFAMKFVRRKSMMIDRIVRRRESESRPSYLPSLKPWNQFLDNEAPGCGSGASLTADTSAAQIIPIGGVKLLTKWKTEYGKLRTDIETVRTR